MYDYREDIKQLLNVTGNTHNELKIAAEAIRVILKIAEKNGNEQQQTVSESEEEQKDDQSEIPFLIAGLPGNSCTVLANVSSFSITWAFLIVSLNE